jgi:hypothetical protein
LRLEVFVFSAEKYEWSIKFEAKLFLKKQYFSLESYFSKE